MIIWINGTFGSGKTTAAYELQKDNRSLWRKKLDRKMITFKEIGIFQ